MTLKLKKCSFYLDLHLYEELLEKAEKNRLSLSTVIRGKLSQAIEQDFAPNPSTQIISHLRSLESKINESLTKASTQTGTTPEQKPDPMTLEILLLLREFLFERNGQVLRKVDERLDRELRGERKKIL